MCSVRQSKLLKWTSYHQIRSTTPIQSSDLQYRHNRCIQNHGQRIGPDTSLTLEFAQTDCCTKKQEMIEIESPESVFIKPKSAHILPYENSHTQYNTNPLGLYLELYEANSSLWISKHYCIGIQEWKHFTLWYITAGMFWWIFWYRHHEVIGRVMMTLSCHALFCFTCPCACLHPPSRCHPFPYYPLCIYTCFLCLFVASSPYSFKLASVVSCQPLTFPSFSFLVLLFFFLPLPVLTLYPPAWPWVHLPSCTFIFRAFLWHHLV